MDSAGAGDCPSGIAVVLRAERVTVYTLHEHQIRAVRHLHANPRAGLFLPMGAGKTLSVLAALKPEHLPVLVVAPKQVAEHVWPAEVRKWRPELSCAMAVGSPTRRAAAIKAKADITVVTRDNMQSLVSTRGKARYRTIVLDESQSFKARSSTRWKMARRLTKTVEHVWALTGTPAGNGLLDLWAQLYLIDHGQRLGETLGGYRQRYFNPAIILPNGVVAKWAIKRGAEEAIHKRLADICLHIPMIGLDLPDITYNRVPTELPAQVRSIYDSLRNDMVADVDMLGGTNIVTAPSAGVLSSKLAQVTAGAIYDDTINGVSPGTYTRLHEQKMDELAEIIDQSDGGVLVFYRFKFEAEAILKRFKQAVPVSRKGAIDQWNAGEIPVMLAHPASAGHGLNLQYGGNTIVWTSVSFNLEEWQQANARLHRQGQKNVVMVHTLTSPGTIDEHILDVLEGKKTVQEALLAALT